jgi:hypothetical protein
MAEMFSNLNPHGEYLPWQIVNREEIARKESRRLRSPNHRSKFHHLRTHKGWAPSRAAPARSMAKTTSMSESLAHALGLVLLVLMARALVFSAAAEQSQLEIGVLTCSLAEGEDANNAGDVTSASEIRKMVCVFRPANSGPEEVYRGGVQIISQDNDLLAGRAIIWIVKGTPTTMRSPGMLQQTYAVDASAAPGHAPPLIGETNSSIILQAMADTPSLADTNKNRRPRSAQPRPSVPSTITLVALTLTSTPA